MNYYPFHIGDFTAHTAHLEPLEDLAYRRMLDQYYLRESALPYELTAVCALVGAETDDQRAAVQSVLSEFFEKTDAGWSHSRCEREIELYRAKKANHWAAKLTKPQRAEMAGERRATRVSATPRWLTKEDRCTSAATSQYSTGTTVASADAFIARCSARWH